MVRVAAARGRRTALLVTVAGLAALVRGVAIWRGSLDGQTLADDAFYYFQIARHVALGWGPTFDGLAPTNGFHPLFLLLLVPVYRLWPNDPWLPIHVALTGLVLLDLASAFFLYRLAAGMGSRTGAFLAALFWLTSPVVLATSSLGMESALSTLFVLATALAYTHWLSAPRRAGRALVLGIAAGLALLARTDSILFVGLLFAHAALVRRREWLRLACWAGLPILLFVGPWALWSWTTFHTFEQSSGAATRLFNIYGHLDSGGGSLGDPRTFAREFWQVARWMNRAVLGREFEPETRAAWIHLGIAAGLWAGIGAVAGALALRKRLHLPVVLRLLLLYVVLHCAYYYFIAATYRPWYPHTLIAIGLLVAAAVLGAALPDPNRHRRALALGCTLLLGLQLADATSFLSHAARQPATRTAAGQVRWLERNCGATARVGYLNAGKIGYLAGYRSSLRIVNLDGVVNNALVEAYRRGEFATSYCKNLDYAAELPAPEVFRDPRVRAAYRDFYRRQVVPIETAPARLFRIDCSPATDSLPGSGAGR